jgi:hypothetical protein
MIPLRLLCTALCLLAMAGCSGFGAAAADMFQGAPEELPSPPQWRVGDRWVFAWTSGKENGSRTLEVREAATVNGVDYYILNVGGGITQYYTKDLHFAAAAQQGKVIARMVPPTPWMTWPLRPAGSWVHRGVYEEPKGTQPQAYTFTVAGVESVTVPAGTFRAFKIIRQADRGDSDQYWYAPEVRWYVRWEGQRAEVSFEERLTAYQAAPRTTTSGTSTR